MSSLCLIVPLQSSPILSLASFGAIIIYRVSSEFLEGGAEGFFGGVHVLMGWGVCRR